MSFRCSLKTLEARCGASLALRERVADLFKRFPILEAMTQIAIPCERVRAFRCLSMLAKIMEEAFVVKLHEMRLTAGFRERNRNSTVHQAIP